MSYRDEAVGWTQNTPQLQLEEVAGEREVWVSLPALDKKKNDRWHYNQLL